jgi:hypothetical protein
MLPFTHCFTERVTKPYCSNTSAKAIFIGYFHYIGFKKMCYIPHFIFTNDDDDDDDDNENNNNNNDKLLLLRAAHETGLFCILAGICEQAFRLYYVREHAVMKLLQMGFTQSDSLADGVRRTLKWSPCTNILL